MLYTYTKTFPNPTLLAIDIVITINLILNNSPFGFHNLTTLFFL